MSVVLSPPKQACSELREERASEPFKLFGKSVFGTDGRGKVDEQGRQERGPRGGALDGLLVPLKTTPPTCPPSVSDQLCQFPFTLQPASLLVLELDSRS